MEHNINANRFTGFANTYESARPSLPMYPINIIKKYIDREIQNVVDLGCGTGLSTNIWSDISQKVIGVEPSLDMLNVAKKKHNKNISFINAYSDNTGLDDNSIDVVVCSQSFHWMEPKSTLGEINRILKNGGVFATVDCDWPPVLNWQADMAYSELYAKVRQIESEIPEIRDSFVRYSKDKHLGNIKASGYFRYSRELLFSNTESCTKDRFVNIILSQGSLQEILKRRPELIVDDVDNFENVINNLLDDKEFDIDFSYRMRIAVK